MLLVNTPSRYGAVAMWLHWLIAAALLANIALGLYFAEIMDDADPLHGPFSRFHESLGLTVLALSVLRVLWRLINPAPPLPRAIAPRAKLLAHLSHFLLYVFILAIPLSGWAMVSASRRPVPTHYFGLFAWPNLPLFATLARPAKLAWHHDLHTAHLALAIGALVLVPIHIAGALYHRRRGHDVLSRMVPWARTVAPPAG